MAVTWSVCFCGLIHNYYLWVWCPLFHDLPAAESCPHWRSCPGTRPSLWTQMPVKWDTPGSFLDPTMHLSPGCSTSGGTRQGYWPWSMWLLRLATLRTPKIVHHSRQHFHRLGWPAQYSYGRMQQHLHLWSGLEWTPWASSPSPKPASVIGSFPRVISSLCQQMSLDFLFYLLTVTHSHSSSGV